jgi:CheY-like chemotaxis protein
MKKVKRTILIIDDNPDDLEFYKTILSKSSKFYKYETLTAEDLSEGLAHVRQNIIDCCFIDYNLPEVNGLEISEKIQKENDAVAIPIVILTGEPHQSIQAEAARQGLFDYVIKDAVRSQPQFERIIDKAILWSEKLQEKAASND